MKRGTFITFEGSEGCGKSTQSRMLAAYLKRKGHRVLFLREPGGTVISEKIRRILLDKKHDAMNGACEMLLYMAARAQVVSEVIKPALADGVIVICDRFLDSTRAYQGYGLGVEPALIEKVGAYATGGLAPDLTIVMDLAVIKGLRHRSGKKDRIEGRSLAYHARVRKGYHALAKREPERMKIVKVQENKEITQEIIREIVESKLQITNHKKQTKNKLQKNK